MAEVVDSIVAELIAKTSSYEQGFDRAIAKHKEFMQSVSRLDGVEFAQGAQQYADRHRKAASDVVSTEEQTSAKVTRARKARADASVAIDEKELASAKRVARERADAEIQEAERSARYRRLAEQAAASAGPLPQSTSGRIGARFTPQPSGQSSIPAGVLAGEATVAAETEANHLLADRFDLSAKVKVAEGGVKRELQEQVEWMRRIAAYKAAGLTESEATLRAEAETLAVEKLRAETTAKSSLTGLGKFAEGAGIGRTGGSLPAVAGLAAAAGAAVVVSAIQNAVEFGKALDTEARQLGVTTTALQVYQAAARDVGVSNTELIATLGQVSANLGKAQDGSQEQQKLFKALGIDIGNARDGYKSLGELLPTIADRLSTITDQTRRNAIETALGGEQLRKLDPILSGGAAKLTSYAAALEQAGGALSPGDVRTLSEASVAFAKVKQQIEVDIAHVVAGNASAIDGLAQSFGSLVNSIGYAIQAIQRFNNQQIKGLGGSNGAVPVPSGVGVIDRLVSNGGKGILGGLFGPPPLANLQSANGQSTGDDAIAQQFKGIGVVQPGAVDQKLLGQLNAPKGPKGKSGDQLAREAAAREKTYQDQLARFRDEELAAAVEQVQDEEARLTLKMQAVQRDLAREKIDIDLQVKEKRIDAIRAGELKEAADRAAAEKMNVLSLQSTLEVMNRTYQAETRRLDLREQSLRDEETLATTIAERRRIELELLDIARQKETLGANYTLAKADQGDPNTSTVDVQAARETLKTQASRDASSRNVINQQNRGPLADYLASLPHTADQVNEALERAAANGAANLTDELTKSVSAMLHLHGAAGQFLEDLIKIGIQMAEAALFKGGGGSGAGGFLGSLVSAAGSLFGGGGSGAGTISSVQRSGTKGFASGGSMTIGGNPGVDQNTLSLNGSQIARVGHGEILSIEPNASASNQRANAAAPQITVIAPQHFDLSGAVMTEQLVGQINAQQKAYTDAVGRASYEAAVKTAGSQVPGRMSRYQTQRG